MAGAKKLKKLRHKALDAAAQAEQAADRAQRAAKVARQTVTSDDEAENARGSSRAGDHNDQHSTPVAERPGARVTTQPRGD